MEKVCLLATQVFKNVGRKISRRLCTEKGKHFFQLYNIYELGVMYIDCDWPHLWRVTDVPDWENSRGAFSICMDTKVRDSTKNNGKHYSNSYFFNECTLSITYTIHNELEMYFFPLTQPNPTLLSNIILTKANLIRARKKRSHQVINIA